MHKRQKLSVAGIGAMGTAALLLSGCGGSSFQKNTFGNYANTLPAAYGIEPTAASPNVQGVGTTFFETSGLGSADSKTAYATAAIDFATLKNPDGSALAINVDPNATGKIPLGFSAGSFYIDSGAGDPAAVAATVAPIGTSSVFRAALANGVSANNAPPIDGNGESLSSADPEWTLGTLPMTFSSAGAGPLANGTYVTGTGGSAVPFTLPFKTSGVHSVVVTVTDTAGRQTATTFGIPTVTAGDVALLLQSFTVAVAATAKAAATTAQNPITPGNTVTIDGGQGTGTYPATGYNAATGKPSAPTVADAQGTVVLFTTPGTHTITETDGTGTVVQQATFVIGPDMAGMTLLGVPVDNGAGAAGGGAGTKLRPSRLRNH